MYYRQKLMITSRVLLALTTMSAGFSCKQRSSISEVRHDTNAPTPGTDAFYWAPSSFDSYLGNAVSPGQSIFPLPASDPLSARLDFWAAQLHQAAVQLNPEQMKGVPPPSIHVAKTGSGGANAWVSALPACIKMPVLITDAATPSANTASFLVFEKDGVRAHVAPFSPVEPTCVDTAWSTNVDAFVEFYNKNVAGSQCRIKINDGRIELSAKLCKTPPNVSGAYAGVFYSTSPHVMINTALIKALDSEEEVVMVLAHELGHYYRSHAIVGATKNNFWYQQEENAFAGVPRAVPDSAALETKRQQYTARTWSEIPGAKIPGMMTDFAVSYLGGFLLQGCVSGGTCPDSCTATRQKYVASPWAREFSIFGSGPSQSAIMAYLEFEGSLLQCVNQIPVVEVGTVQGLKVTPEGLRRRLAIDLVEVPDGLTDGVTNVGELLAKKLIPMSLAFEEERRALYAQVEKRHLGLYTVEQEADEFSLELGATLGINPEVSLSAEEHFGRSYEKADPKRFLTVNGLTMNDCLALKANDWHQQVGNESHYVFVTLGSLRDIHHGTCYRMFNSSREIRAHQYVVGKAPAIPASPTWLELKKIAQDICADIDSHSMIPGPAAPAFSEVRQGVGPIIVDVYP